jgi:hypothetical protein
MAWSTIAPKELPVLAMRPLKATKFFNTIALINCQVMAQPWSPNKGDEYQRKIAHGQII